MAQERKKQARTWQKEGVDVATLNGNLIKADRETSISFYDVGAKNAELTTANPTWQKRIESLGIIPHSITRFEDDLAEIRYYDKVPISYIKMPADGRRGSKSANKSRKKAKEWKKEGIEVTHMNDYTIDKAERETCIHYCAPDREAWVLTSQTKWQNRIEGKLGIKPFKIYTYKGTGVEQREYMIPVKFIKMPSRGRGRPPKNA